MSIFSTIFGGLWKLIKPLFESTENAFNDLPQEQQNAILNGAQVSQILKDNVGRGETYVKEVIKSRLNLSQDVVDGLFDQLSKDLNYTGLLDGIADKIGQGITDASHNALFDDIAKFASLFLGAGAVNWITLALGAVTYAYHYLQAHDKLIKPINTAAAAQTGDPIGGDPTKPGGH